MPILWIIFSAFLLTAFRNICGSNREEIRRRHIEVSREHIESAFVVSMFRAEGARGLEVYDDQTRKLRKNIEQVVKEFQGFMDFVDTRIFTKARNLKQSLMKEINLNDGAVTKRVVLVLKEASSSRDMYLDIGAFIVKVTVLRRYSASKPNYEKEFVMAILYSNGYLLLGLEDGYQNQDQPHVKIISFLLRTATEISLFRIKELRERVTVKKSSCTLSREDLGNMWLHLFPDEKRQCDHIKSEEEGENRRREREMRRKGIIAEESASRNVYARKSEEMAKRKFPVGFLLDKVAFKEIVERRQWRDQVAATTVAGGASTSSSKKSNTKKITEAMGKLSLGNGKLGLGKLVSSAKKAFKSRDDGDSMHYQWDGK